MIKRHRKTEKYEVLRGEICDKLKGEYETFCIENPEAHGKENEVRRRISVLFDRLDFTKCEIDEDIIKYLLELENASDRIYKRFVGVKEITGRGSVNTDSLVSAVFLSVTDY